MKKPLFFGLLTYFLLIFPLGGLYAQAISTNGHSGKITSLIHNGETIISAGEDGFIVIWNAKEKKSVERFQLSPYSIQAAIKHPSRAEICIVEAAGINDYRLSVWNYIFKHKLFSVRSNEPISLINYSSEGRIIITAGLNGAALSLLDSGTGQLIAEPIIPQCPVLLAITGRAERSMLIYQTNTEHGGQLSYLNMEDASVTRSFSTHDNLLNPVIFGNGRYLAGTGSGGLFVIDAASGDELANLKNIEKGALLCPADDSFFCIGGKGGKNILYRFSINRNGRISTTQELNLKIDSSEPNGSMQISALAYKSLTRTIDSIVFSSSNGSLLLLEQNGNTTAMAHNFQTRAGDIAASSSKLAVLTEKGAFFLLPLDYARLEDSENLLLEKKEGYTQISALGSEAKKSEEGFILWQKTNTKYIPQIVYPDKISNDASLKFLSGRYPISSLSSKNGMILVLYKSGDLSLFREDSLKANNPAPFEKLSIMGAMDAAFIDSENLLLCLTSVLVGSNPFIFVNIKTHETIPFSSQALEGSTAYVGKSGNIYAVALEAEDLIIKTKVLKLTPSKSEILYVYPGEDANISIAESGGQIAISCGSDGAAIYEKEAVYFERTEGLPVKLLGSEKYFLCMDSEGSISWHDNKTGKLLAVFKFYEDKWFLTGDKEISGSFTH